MAKLGIPTDGGADGVTVLKQGFNVDPLLQKQADCISTMTYNEYWQVIDAGMKPEDLVVFKYEDQGVATLEDGLYVLESSLADPAMVDKLARFLKASMKGWDYAVENPDEAAEIVLENDDDRRPDREAPEAHDGRDRQARRRAATRASATSTRPTTSARCEMLLAGGSDPVITKSARGRLDPQGLGGASSEPFGRLAGRIGQSSFRESAAGSPGA